MPFDHRNLLPRVGFLFRTRWEGRIKREERLLSVVLIDLVVFFLTFSPLYFSRFKHKKKNSFPSLFFSSQLFFLRIFFLHNFLESNRSLNLSSLLSNFHSNAYFSPSFKLGFKKLFLQSLNLLPMMG